MTLPSLEQVLTAIPLRIVACSGGVDSMLLASAAHRAAPDRTVVAHDVTPAVPAAATARVVAQASVEGWRLELVRSTEFDDEEYLRNPLDRCFHCKRHLYDCLAGLAGRLRYPGRWTLLSGANLDDLGEYRPGLDAAAQRGVRHPFIEAGWAKADVRDAARRAGLTFADLPASPCLASRLYTGTRVTPARLRAVEIGEELVRSLTGIDVVRCRVRDDQVLIEVPAGSAGRVDALVLEQVIQAMRAIEPSFATVSVDPEPYRSGRALVFTS